MGTTQILDNGVRGVLDANIGGFNSDSVLCARRIVQQQIDDGFVMISVVNPATESFSDYGVDGYHDVTGMGDIRTVKLIPNDNLMYRDSRLVTGGGSQQSVQDANLLKIHVGYCYELIIPFIDRIVWGMQRYGAGNAPAAEQAIGNYWNEPSATPPGFFGPPQGQFAASCITAAGNTGRRSIVLYSQSIMRMQSPAVQCETTDTCAT